MECKVNDKLCGADVIGTLELDVDTDGSVFCYYEGLIGRDWYCAYGNTVEELMAKMMKKAIELIKNARHFAEHPNEYGEGGGEL